MVTCQKWMALLVSLQLLAVGTLAIPSPSSSSNPRRTDENASSVQLDSDTGDDRELKSDDDGYDFLSIDQLFLNNPQYRQLISDLQAHTFGSNWRRKRDVAENELPDAFRTEESLSSARAGSSTVAAITTTAKSTTAGALSSSTVKEALVTDVATNRDMAASSTASDMPKAAALTSTPTKSKEGQKEVTKPATVSSTSGTSSGTTTSTTTTTTTVTTTPVRGSSSTIATSASYGSSGSTELPVARNATLEMTTAAAPIRASTPRRLSHKNSSNKNKNKLSAAVAAAQAAANKPSTSVPGPNTVNVNKVSVSSNAVASSSNQQLPQQTPAAVAIPATENGTASGPAGNNKDKVSLFQ
uniref:Uncharacterized protein n=1 Tax=Anopheles christyi TaxID=43041 RepID=A0A182JXC1_9DIPT